MSATTPIYVPKLRGGSCFLLIKLQQIEAATTKKTSLWTFPISLPRSRGNCWSLKCSRPEGSGAVGSTGWGACCHENTEESEEAGGCPPSLDGIAGGLCVGIAKINWIPVILWKCDSVMWSYESTLVILTIETLKPACLCCCSQQMTKHRSKPYIPQSYRCYLNLFLVSRSCVLCKGRQSPKQKSTVSHRIPPWAFGCTPSSNFLAINESVSLFPCHTCRRLRCLQASHPASNSVPPFLSEDSAMCSACRWLLKAVALKFPIPPDNNNPNRLQPLEQINN